MGINVGVIGVGRLGREHVRVFAGLEGVEGVFCHDIDRDRAAQCAEAHGAVVCDSVEALFSSVDAVSVVAPTTEHSQLVMRALDAGKDVFVEKPMAPTVGESEAMIRRARATGRVLQVGHVERFNAAVQAVASGIDHPEFIEIHRLSPFTVRGTDVSVVGDLMIHDLDLLGLLVGEWPSEVRAKGAAILTDGPDIVNARLEYPGGCVANVTASRVTASPMRKVRIFSRAEYISIDLLQGRAVRYRRSPSFERNIAELRSGTAGGRGLNLTDFVEMETITPDASEPLARELDAFRRCVASRELPPVTGEDGLRAVKLAVEVLDSMGVPPTGGRPA